MADKKTSSRKKPVSQKRVAVVLASLVGTLTLSAGVLLLMEAGAVGSPPMGATYQTQPALAFQLTPAVPLRPEAWNYIIIYESGDTAGSAASLADGHLNGEPYLPSSTVRPKANFHFVIDSARSRRDGMDGDLEVGTTWQKQEAGAPYAGWPDLRYHQVSPYNNAVGVCLIGNLEREPISETQNRRLIQVVRELESRLNLPNDRILFQWELEPNVKRMTPLQKDFAASFRTNLE